MDTVIISRHIQNKDIPQALRAQFDAGRGTANKNSTSQTGIEPSERESEEELELGVRVHVEHSVKVDYKRSHMLESTLSMPDKPRRAWESVPSPRPGSRD